MYAEAGDIDRGWAWMILLGTFVGATLTGTTLYGSSIINTALLEEYNGSVAYTSLIGSLFTSLLALLGPISSVCINLLGNRVTTIIGAVLVFIGFSTSYFVTELDYMLITYGLIAGCGFGFYATPVMVCLGKYFDRRRGLASGLFMTGGGLGMFISGPLIQFLVEKYSLRGAMLIIGALMSNLILVGAVMRPSSVEIEETRIQKRNRAENTLTLKEKLATLIHIDIFKNVSFLFVMAQYFSWNLSFSMITLHITNFAIVKGSSKSEAAFLLTILGLSHTIGRFLGGIFIGPNGFDPLLLNIGCCGLTGLSSILLPFYSSTYQGQILFAVLFGFYSGGICILNVPLCANFVQLAHLSTAIGFFFFIGGIGYLVGPPIAEERTYTMPFTSVRKKLVVVGDGACGKTCLLVVFSQDEFPKFYIPTVFDTFVADIVVDKTQVELALWDTAGQEDYDRLRPLSYPDTDVILICFSYDNPDSLVNVKEKWYPEVRHFCPNVPVILVGNKKDTRNDPEVIEELKRIKQVPLQYKDALVISEQIRASAYLECSAKTKEGVFEVFETAAKTALLKKKRNFRRCKLL
ncbi:hypothetical protein FSP39_014668 [Pinctada imbricata]|uniref:Major facilitator superfamily (MFS) profile domain-containing protein n=1 Tax=Pinctada imbricata TaxID=66713 RepID=A0AA88YF32_PINIB|nr:hypothetical protein FSP39_014668 [Pinctada imbricata]